MERKYIEEFVGKNVLGKDVIVGVPHYCEPRPFYYHGKIVELNDTLLILKIDNGFKQIKLDEVVHIQLQGD